MDAINDINRMISNRWELELVKYDERNDELTFQYKREIKEQ
mgnify:CR=1 FL=1